MAVICRVAKPDEYQAMIEVEKTVFPGHYYLPDVEENFKDPKRGVLLVSEEDGKITGVDHVGFLCDGSGWMETLRVLPEYQGRGAGNAIWKKALEICEENKLNALRMYTGLTNVRSKHLGEKFGLSVAVQTQEANLLKEEFRPEFAAPAGKSPEEAFGFEKVTDGARAYELIRPYAEGYQNYICFNRTYVPLNEQVCAWLADQGFVYACGSNVAVLGGRYMRKHALHIGVIGGDLELCLAFAMAKFDESGLPKFTCMYPSVREDIREALRAKSFAIPENHIIMLERKFDW